VSGWYGGSSTRAETTDRLKHGEFSTRAYRTNRAFTLHGTVIAPDSDERDWQERNLSGLAGDGDWVTVECDDGNAVLSVTARLDGEPQIVKAGVTALRFQIPFAADSPFLHGSWRESTLQPVGAGVGFEFPPLSRDLGQGPVVTFGTAVDTAEYVWNDGNAVSYTRHTVTADAPGGFAVGLGDRRVTFPWPTFPDMPVTVDMAGSVTVSGVDQSHLLGERDWAGVGPHSVDMPVFELLQGGTGFCTVAHRDTFI